MVYTIASLAQLVVGKLIDRYPIKRIYLPIVAAQVPLFLLAAYANGWALYAVAVLFMLFVFGAIPFIDAMIVLYVDDRMRSRERHAPGRLLRGERAAVCARAGREGCRLHGAAHGDGGHRR